MGQVTNTSRTSFLSLKAEVITLRQQLAEAQGCIRGLMDDLEAERRKTARLTETIREARDALWNALISEDHPRPLKSVMFNTHRQLDLAYLHEGKP